MSSPIPQSPSSNRRNTTSKSEALRNWLRRLAGSKLARTKPGSLLNARVLGVLGVIAVVATLFTVTAYMQESVREPAASSTANAPVKVDIGAVAVKATVSEVLEPNSGLEKNAGNDSLKFPYSSPSSAIDLMPSVPRVVDAPLAGLTGTKNVPGDYATLALAITDLNTNGVGAGGVTFNVTAAQTAPAGGYVIGGVGSLVLSTSTATDTITFTGNGNTITAGTPQSVGAVNDAVIKLIGADFVTIQGFTIQENAGNVVLATSATNTMTELGVALFYVTATDGAKNNTIQNNTITLNRAYATTIGIFSTSRTTSTALTTTAEATTTGGTNTNNKFYGNNISNTNYAIALIGASPAALHETGNDIGGTSAGTGNTITNFSTGTAQLSSISTLTGSNYAIFSNHQVNDNISFNSITNAAVASAVTQGGILKNYSVANPTGTITTTINNNTVTITNNPTAATTGGIIGINNQGAAALLATATMSMNNNTVQNCVLGGATSTTNGITGITNLSLPGTMNMNGNSVINNAVTATTATTGINLGISNSGAAGTVNINNNVVRNLASTSASGQVQGVANSGAVTTAININNNQFGNGTGGFFSTATATSGALFGAVNANGASTALLTMTGNDIRGTTYSGAASASQNYYNNQVFTGSTNISNNTITNITANTTGGVTFIGNSLSHAAGTTHQVNNNSIVTAYNKTGAGGTILFYNAFGSSANTVTETNSGNNFSNMTFPSGASIIGWRSADGTTPGSKKIVTNNTFNNISGGTYPAGTGAVLYVGFSDNTAATNNVSDNVISNISGNGTVTGILSDGQNQNFFNNRINTLSSTGAAAAVTGISITGATTQNIFRNKIYDLSGSDAAATVNGITVAAGTTNNISNNLIGDLRAPAATSALDSIRGINLTSTTASSAINVYYNSIFLNAAVGGANFGTTGIFHTASSTGTTATLNLRNNIIVNSSVANGTGLAVAYRRSAGAAGNLANYASASNNNDFFAGTPSPSRLIYSDGVSTAQTITDYKTGVFTAGTIAPRDAASISENPPFLSTTGSNAAFLHINTATPTTIENAGTPIVGFTIDYDNDTRANPPDIGADEVTTMQFSSATYTVAENVGGGVFTVTVTRTANSGNAATVNYATSPGGGTTAGTGSCLAGDDYLSTSGTLNFAAADTSKTFDVTICNDAVVETGETVTLTLSTPTGSILGSPNSAVLTITNDDVAPTDTDVAVTGGNLVITDGNGGNTADTLNISLNGANVRINDPAHTLTAGVGATQIDPNTVEVPLASITGSIQVNTLDGNDTLTLNLAGGDFIPTGGLSFAGGAQTSVPGDRLVITGGSQGMVTYNYTNANDGSINMAAFGTVTYTGLEPISNSGSATDVIFNLPAGTSNNATLSDLGGGSSRLASAGTFEQTDFANPSGSVTITGGSINDFIAVNALAANYPSLTINGGQGTDVVNFNGNITFAVNKNLDVNLQNDDPTPGIDDVAVDGALITSGTGTIDVRASEDVIVNTNGRLQTQNGNLTVEANQQATSTATDHDGVMVNGGVIESTGSGNVLVKGRGGEGAFDVMYGVIVWNAGKIRATGTGTVTVEGTGGARTGGPIDGESEVIGVNVYLLGSEISSTSGAIQITGQGGATNDTSSYGVVVAGGKIQTSGAGTLTINGTGGVVTGGHPVPVDSAGVFVVSDDISGDGGVVASTGTSVNAGNIVITGTSGPAGNGAGQGLRVDAPGTVTTVDGSLTLIGTGGACGNACLGTSIRGQVEATGTGAINITGTGAASTGAFPTHGVNVRTAGFVTTTSGNITITGTGGNGTDNAGFNVGSSGPGTVQTTGGGTITVNADTIRLAPSANATIAAGASAVSLLQKTNTVAINLGSPVDTTANTLELSDGELDRITAGTLNIGNAASGTITVSNTISRSASTNINLVSNGDIVFSFSLDSFGGNVSLTPAVTGSVKVPGSGLDVAMGALGDGTLSFSSGADLSIVINGTSQDVNHDSLGVRGKINLNGVDLVLSGGAFAIAPGQQFKIVDKEGNLEAITGTFNGLPQGATIPNFLGSGFDAQISYTHGDGNDVMLTVLAGCTPPSVVYVDDNWVGTLPSTDPDAGGPAVNFGCDSFATIQDGINGVATSGTVIVRAGTYSQAGSINLNKSLVLQGPNSAISPNGGVRFAEAVITGPPSTVLRISAPGTPVTIEGFKFDNAGVIDAYDPALNITIRKNIFSNGISNGALYFLNAPPQLTIDDNRLTNAVLADNDTVFVAGNWNGTTGTVATITNNVIENTPAANASGMNLSNVSGTVSGNQFKDLLYYAVLLANNSSSMTVSDNVFDGMVNPDPGTVPTWGAGVRTYTPSFTGLVSITRNTFRNSYTGVGLRGVPNDPGADITGMNIHVNFNRFTGNTFGISDGAAGTLDAENNWWGCNYGPGTGGAGCTGTPNGIGLNGTAVVDSNPWIVLGTSASPNPTTPFGNSTVTADMTRNSNSAVPAGGPVPLIPVSFSATNGTVFPTSGTITAGQAMSTFTSTINAAGSACSLVDAQNVCTVIGVAPPTFSIDDVTQNEGNGGPGTTSFTFTITKNGPGAASVDYNTVDGSAVAPSDYTAIPATPVSFLSTDATKQITVLVNGDTAFEGNEDFTVHLSNAVGATITDADGTGTITNDDACGVFTTVYVDDSWAATPIGTDPDGGGPATIFGCDSFATIQGGVTGVASGGTVSVAAGTYIENVTIAQPLTLTGAGEATVFLLPALSAPNTCGGASLCPGGSNLILVQASNVTVSGITLDGDNPALTSVENFGGANIDARNGLITNHALGTFNNLEVHHLTVKNIYLRGMYASSGGTFNFHHNTVQNVQASPGSIGMFNFLGAGTFDNNNVSACNDAISSNHSRGTTYTANTVTTSGSGIHSDNAGDSGGTPDTISGNTISNGSYGIFVFVPYKTVTIENNILTNMDVGVANFGDSGMTTTTRPSESSAVGGGQHAAAGRTAPKSVNISEPGSPLLGQLAAAVNTPLAPPTPPFAALFKGNTIDGQNKALSTGVYFTTDQLGFGNGNPKVAFTSNTVINNADGFFLEAATGFTLETAASFNRIVSNSNSAVTQRSDAGFTGTVNGSMENNWWGCNLGPNNPGCGTVVGAGVDFNPWLILGVSASPNPITPGGTSTVTADMTHNSNAAVVSGPDFVPPVGVSFTATQGTIAPPTGTITAGQATALFTSTSASNGSATATVDGQPATTAIVVTQPSFTINDVTLAEGTTPPGTTSFTFTITKTGATTFNANVDWATADGTAVSTGGTPDFTSVPATTLTFLPADTTMQITVLVNKDFFVEPDEAFTVQLSNAVGATIGDASGTGTIQNDDTPPNTVYVDDNFTGAPGTDPDGVGPANAIGYDAFATIQGGIDGVAVGGTVNVAAGSYIENPNVNKAATLVGPNAGVAGSAVRNPEAFVRTNGNQVAVFSVSAANVTINGFSIDGDDPGVGGSALFSGDDANVQYGVRPTTGAVNNLTVSNNIVKRVFIGIRGDVAPAQGNVITRNWFDSIGNFDFGYAVSIRNNFYANVTDNKMTRAWTGIHINNHNGATGPASFLVTGNEIHSYAGGILYWLQFNGATGATINNNQITAETGAVANNFGVLFVSIQNAVNPTFTSNAIAGHRYGIGLFNVPTTSTITLGSTNSVTGSTLAGVFLTDNLSFNPVGTTNFLAGGPGAASTVNVTGLPITGNTGGGLKVEGNTNLQTLNVTGATVTGAGGARGFEVVGGFGKANLISSTITGFATGIALPSTSAQLTTAHFNRILATIAIDNPGSVVVNLENNWWGCNAGPGNAGCGIFTGAPAQTDFNPWIVLLGSATPNSIVPGGTSTVAADMTHNSAAAVPVGTLPDIPVAYAATHGTMTPTSDTIIAGADSSLFTSTDSSSAVATITVDNQPVNVPITVTPPAFSIDDVTQLEGNPPGTTAYTFTITKTGATALNSSVDYETVNGSAVAPSDFTAIPVTTLTFLPADTSKQVTVLVNKDIVLETDEAFTVHLSNAVTATISDADGTGTIQNDDVQATVVYVDDNWVGVPNGNDPDGGGPATAMGYDAFATVQGGVSGVAAGGTVNVYAGNYIEDVTISNASLQLLGFGPGVKTISGAIGGSGATITVGASNVTVAGFTITREGNNVAQWNDPNLNSTGVAIQGLAITNMLVRDNIITGNRTGIDVNNSNGHTIRNNTIDFNRTGMIFRNQTEFLTVVENFLTNNWTVGIVFLDASSGSNVPVQSAKFSVFSNNNMSANWYGQIVDRQTGGSLPAPGANPKNFKGNWYGTTSPIVTTANSTEPGYAAQIPVAYGGSAVPPGGQPDIAGSASANFQYTPFLQSGTDTNIETVPGRGTNGFQGVQNAAIVVRSSSLKNWIQTHDTCGAAATGSQAFVVGPPTPPIGEGSLQYLIGANGDSVEAARSPDYNGLHLDALTRLSYSTYAATAGGQAPYMRLDVDNDNNGTLDDSLFFEPVYQNGGYSTIFPETIPNQCGANPNCVVTGQWQTWNTLVGGWWSNVESAGGPPLISLARYAVEHPGARIINSGVNGGLRISSGCGAGAWDNFNGNTDDLMIGVSGANTRYDFEPLPRLSIDDVTHNEGQSGTTTYTFTVSLSRDSDQTVTVDYATANDSAIAPGDYTAIPTTPLTFNPGETSKTIVVNVNGDMVYEGNEQFFVNLSNPNAHAVITDGQGVGTITDDDTQPSFAIDNVTHFEGNSGTTAYTFTVTKTGATEATATVNFQTQDGTATLADNDYQTNSGLLTFLGPETSKPITVLVNGDTNVEPAEAFNVQLSGATNATISDANGTGTILNDDPAPPIVYVDDDWAAVNPGDDPDAGGPATSFGYDAFATIQGGVGAVATNGMVIVYAGTYNGPQILINRSMSVTGAGAATTIINGLGAAPPTAGLVHIETLLGDTGNVTFSGFTVTNQGTGGGTKPAIFAKPLDPLTTVTISNNKILGVNSGDNGLYVYRNRGAVVFDHNEITNVAFNGVLIEQPLNATNVHTNTISVTGTSSSYFGMTYDSENIASLQRVADNTINSPLATAITFNSSTANVSAPLRIGKYTNVQITGNVITQLGVGRSGIALLNDTTDPTGALGAIENPAITGNRITGTDAATSNGIRFRGLVTNAAITSNDLRDTNRGFLGEVAVAGHSATGTQLHFNNIVSNLTGLEWNGSAAFNAENNWWGCNFGPGIGGAGCTGTANGVAGTGAANVDSNPWIVLGTNASPNPITPGGSSTVTADMLRNSNGAVVSGPNFVPSVGVAFTATEGTILPPTATITSGQATSTFTSTSTNSGSACSMVDGQLVCTAITVTAPAFTIDDVSHNEGDAGTTAYTFTITKTGATTFNASVDYATVNGTAVSTGGTPDFTAIPTTNLVFLPADTTKQVTVLVNGDIAFELDEAFTVHLSNSIGATIGDADGTGTIVNDDTDVSVAVSPSSVAEDGVPNLVYTFTRAGVTTGPLTINFSVSGTAVFGSDYTQSGAATFSTSSGTVTFGAGNANAAVTIDPSTDAVYEAPETVILTVTAGAGYNVASPSSATGTINNDDPIPTSLVVTKTDDTDDGFCTLDDCSLREAIGNANVNADANTITFNIPTSDPNRNVTTGVYTITPAAALPAISQPVTIDGYSQEPCPPSPAVPCSRENTLAVGSDALLLIEINGVNAGGYGLIVDASNTVLKGLVINRSTQSEIWLRTGTNQSVRGSYLGTNAAGTTGLVSTVRSGVEINGNNTNTIGGANPADRNVISGGAAGIFIINSGSGNTVQNNYIGTDKSGTLNLTGSGVGVLIDNRTNNTIKGNLISGNNSHGVQIRNNTAGGTANTIQGNLIGTQADGVTALGNGGNGVFDENGVGSVSAGGNTIGGTGVGESNIIAFNSGDGVLVTSAVGSTISGTVIRANSIHSNTGLGIDLGTDGVTANDNDDPDTGANNLQNFPVITSVLTSPNLIRGTLNSIPSQAFTIDLYTNPTCDPSGNGEGRNYFGSTVANTDANGDALWSFSPVTLTPGTVITATATDASGSTSEFSGCSVAMATAFGEIKFAQANTNDTETNAGAHTVNIVVQRVNGADFAVGVTYTITDGSATTADNDYSVVLATGTLSWADGDISNRNIPITVNGDTKFELDETVNITLSAPTGGATITGTNPATLTIQNDDTAPTISINDVTQNETNAGTTDFDFTISMSNASYQTVTVNAATADNTALTADADYTGVPVTLLTFTPNTTTQHVHVLVNGDNKFEPTETFFVNLSGATNSSLIDNQGLGTITNDDPQPTILIDDVTQAETNAGTTNFNFTVTLSNPSAQTITVDYSTDSFTATSPVDFTAIPATQLTFNPGETSKPVTVVVNGDAVYELDESFFVNLTNLSNATTTDQGIGTITNDDAAPTLAIGDRTLNEGTTIGASTSFNFTVTKTGTTDVSATVNFATADGIATGSFLACPSGDDYQQQSGSLTFLPAETTMTITVPVCKDPTFEGNETFFVNLSGEANATITDGQGLGTILNDDFPSVGLSVNTTDDINDTICSATHCSLREAIIAANGGATAVSIAFAIPADDPRHFYYADDGSGSPNGQVTLANVTTTAATDDTTISGIDPDWPHSWWSILPTSQLPATTKQILVDGYTQTGASANNATTGTNAILRIELNGASAGANVIGLGIGGPSSTMQGLVINRFLRDSGAGTPTGDGLNLVSGNHTVQGNFIGTDVSGTLDLGNGGSGITAPGSFMTLGGPSPALVNLISGNDGDGIVLTNSNSTLIQGNLVGTTANGVNGVGNGGSGISLVGGGTTFNTIGGIGTGEANTLAFNGADGLSITNAGIGNNIRVNSIFSNGTTNLHLGIDLGADGVTANDNQDGDAGPNNLQNFPVITTALVTGSTRTITGTLNSVPGQTFDLDFYQSPTCDASGNGEGKTYIGSITTDPTDASGNVAFTFHPAVLTVGQTLTATATSTGASFSTSEFSQCAAILDGAGGAGDIQFVAANYAVLEGAGTATITVTRVGGTNGSVTANFSTSNGTAQAPGDYATVTSVPFTYVEGETGNKTVTVSIVNDSIYETNETINLALSTTQINRPSAPSGDPHAAVLTITDNDPQPSFTISDVTLLEGNSGTTSFGFTVTKTGSTEVNATVDYSTSSGSATSPSDFTAIPTTTLTFLPAETTKPVTVLVNGDTTVEPNELFTVNLANAMNATIADSSGQGTITNDDTDVSVAVSPSSVAEDSAPNLVYTFTRTGVTAGALTINFSVGGSAAFGTDYTQTGAATFAPTGGTVTFGAGNSTAAVTLDPTADTTAESDETAILTVTTGVGYNVGSPAAATGTITADDTDVSLAVAPAAVTEDGVPNLVYTFTRNGVTTGALTVNFSVGGSATFATDYTQTGAATFTPTTGTVTFGAGNSTAAVTINPTADVVAELDETVILTVTAGTGYNVASPSAATGTINNDDSSGGIIRFSSAVYNTTENSHFTTITVQRVGDSSGAVTVDYATPDDSESPTVVPCATVNGSASPRCDFTTALGTLRFAAGETSKTFIVLISQDNYTEGAETLTLTLSNLTGGAVFGVPSTATLTIADDLVEPSQNPLDDAENFVRQHYHDFLNREPDPSGLAFWTNQITSCGGDQDCIAIKRINVSAAFYLSIEFQDTGYFVERLYKTAYGDATGTSTLDGAHTLPVPIVRFSEFLLDTQEIGQGVIVGQPGWEIVLADNKAAFVARFVQRTRFTNAYPGSMTPAVFVDTLNANAGNPLSPAERNQLVADLTANPAARAQVLRAVAEDPQLVNAEVNRAFVLMQYFGYLRRNVNVAPDTDYTGYDFWLRKLNEFNGNFVNAEMVKAFIVSAEYRRRAGLN